MASKSKRRGRVFRASCILAALIIAGSSFAWFTSKDEVTNRLTANADYDVSIIENFAPPKQWTPGQTVKKEEAVVNTGSIDAFVKQQITGDLKVTVEVPVSTAPTLAAHDNYITLKPSEYGSIEAGSYLAWAPEGEKIGTKVVYAIDNADPNKDVPETNFKPTKTGLYIFRRAITTVENETDPANQTLTDTAYEYVGYYYVSNNDTTPVAGEGTYYKLNRIVKNTLEAGANGNLASAPTVMYAKTETDVIKNVPMTYKDDSSGSGATNPRLEVSYQTNRSSTASAMANLDKLAYQAYDAYLDALTGKTSWRESATYSGKVGKIDDTTVTYAADTDNKTGLTDYDEFFNTTGGTPDPLLTNWSLERLQQRATETQADLDDASPSDKYDGSGTTSWTTVYEAAVADRKTVNKGVKSAERLNVLKTALEGIVGSGDNNGIHQADTYGFHYSSDTYTVDGSGKVTVVAPSVKLLNPTTSFTGNDINGEIYNLTLDNMNDDGTGNNDGLGKFSDTRVTAGADSDWGGATAYSGSNTTVSAAKFDEEQTTDKANFNAQFNYTGAGTALKNAWDAYVKDTKRQVLVDAKIDMVERAIAAATNSTTDAGRLTELNEILTALKSEKRTIDGALANSKAAYEKLILGDPDNGVKGVKDYIDQLNKYQDDINAANEVDHGKTAPADLDNFSYTAVYVGDQSTVSTYPSTKSSVQGSGTTDTLTEAVLKKYLENTYGIAVKDDKTLLGDSGVYVAEDYIGENDSDETTLSGWPASDAYKDIYTYSPTVTKATIDANLDKTGPDGKIAWKSTPDPAGYGKIAASSGTGVLATQTEIEATPYYIDEKVDMMTTYRQNQVDGLLATYNTAKANAVGMQDSDENLDPIKITVYLANVDNAPDAAQKWQYIPNATGANEYNFFYTSVLGSGQTSNLLIKSVKMDESVTQDMFKDLQFDLNVGAESAQAIYEDGLALPTSANESLSGGKTTQTTGYAEGAKVAWEKKTTAPNPAITNEDPDGKAGTEIDGTTYTKAGKLDGAASTNYIIKKVPATTVSGDSYIYQITVDANNVFYGNSVESGAEFKKVEDPTADSLAFASTESKIVLD